MRYAIDSNTIMLTKMCSPYTFSWTSRLRPSVPPELNPTGRNLHEQSLYIRVQARLSPAPWEDARSTDWTLYGGHGHGGMKIKEVLMILRKNKEFLGACAKDKDFLEEYPLPLMLQDGGVWFNLDHNLGYHRHCLASYPSFCQR